MNKKLFYSDRKSDYLAFGENRNLLSRLEPELCPLEDKMLDRIQWPKMTSISDLRGHWVLKVGVWGDLIWYNIYAEFEPNGKGSVPKLPKFDRFDVEWP